MYVYYVISWIGLSIISTSHCAMITKEEQKYEKPYDIWTGAKILFEKYSESNIDRSGIGSRRKSIDLPAFTFYANEQFDSGSDFHYGNEHITMDNINQVNSLRRTKTLQGIGSQSNKRLWKIGRDEGRIEKQRSLPSFKDLSRSSNTAKKEVGMLDIPLIQRYKQIKNTEVENKDKVKDTSVYQVSAQEGKTHQNLMNNNLKRTTTLQGVDSQSYKRILEIGRDERQIEKQKSLPSFKDLSRSRNIVKKDDGILDIQLLQRYDQIKNTEVENKDRNVPVSSKVESGFSEPTEKIGESNRNKITGVFKDDPSSQKDGLLKTATSDDKFLQEDKIRYKKSVLKETTNQNSLKKVKVDPSDLQDVYSEEERLNKVKKTLSLREKPNRNDRHEISSDSLENSCIETLDEIGSAEGGKEKQINRSLREVPLGLAKSVSSKEDFDWKGQKPPQNQHQAADLSSEDTTITEKNSISQKDSQRDEMLTEALNSPQSVSVSTPHKMGAKSGKDNVAPKSPDSSREELTNFEEKDMVEDEDQDSDEVDQIESRTSQPSQVKRFVGKKVNKKSKKVKNKKSKNKGKTKDYEQDELKIKEDDQIENFEKNDKSLKPLIPIEDVKDFSKIDKDEFLKDIINPKNQIPMLKIKLSKLQFEYLRSMGFGRDSWSKPFSNLRMEFNDLYEADRRIASVQRQFYAVQVTYMWKEEGETLSPELKEMGKILRFDEPFPDFQDQTSDQLNRLYDLAAEVGVEQVRILRRMSEWQFEKRLATLFMMIEGDVYRQSEVLQDALSRDLIKEGYLLPVVAKIDHILELSSERENWKDLSRDQIKEKVHEMLGVMCGIVKLHHEEKFHIFNNNWKEEPTRTLFTMKDDRLSKIFAIRMKSLASLADKMNIEFPQTHQIEENYSEKIISTGECLIAQHVGLSIELLRKFKIWLNFKEPKDKLKSRTIGNWENVPIEFTRKGHLFKEYFELRLEKVRGLENWYRECKKILVFEDVQ